MKKKILSLMLVICFAISSLVLLTGCDAKLPEISENWSYNKNYHWHSVSYEDKEFMTDYGEHSFGDDNVCDICGYIDEDFQYAYYKSLRLSYAGVKSDYEFSEDFKTLTVTEYILEDKEKSVYSYDDNYLLTEMTVYRSILGEEFEEYKKYVYTHDEQGRLTQETKYYFNEMPNKGTKTIYTYFDNGYQTEVYYFETGKEDSLRDEDFYITTQTETTITESHLTRYGGNGEFSLFEEKVFDKATKNILSVLYPSLNVEKKYTYDDKNRIEKIEYFDDDLDVSMQKFIYEYENDSVVNIKYYEKEAGEYKYKSINKQHIGLNNEFLYIDNYNINDQGEEVFNNTSIVEYITTNHKLEWVDDLIPIEQANNFNEMLMLTL